MSATARKECIRETREFWDPRAPARLTDADAAEAIDNVTGFFALLDEWDRADRAKMEADEQAA